MALSTQVAIMTICQRVFLNMELLLLLANSLSQFSRRYRKGWEWLKPSLEMVNTSNNESHPFP